MLKIGITGGIGSGKTTVCTVFELLGIPVFYADDEAKGILDKEEVKKALVELFSSVILNENGKIDRKKLANIVFTDTSKLQLLNGIIHPAVGKRFNEWFDQYKDSPYVLHEAAILFESGANKQVDKVIMVSAPQELRMKRILRRDKTTEAEILKRMSNQLSDEKKVALSDYVIVNDEQKLMIEQVLVIHKLLIEHK